MLDNGFELEKICSFYRIGISLNMELEIVKLPLLACSIKKNDYHQKFTKRANLLVPGIICC